MKKLLSFLTVTILLTSSTTNLVSFQTKLNNLNKDIRTKTKTNLKNNNLKQENQNQAKANSIMTKLANQRLVILCCAGITKAYQYKDEIQWALNDIVSQKDTPYTFYFANADGNKVLNWYAPQSIFIGVEVNGVKTDLQHQGIINVILGDQSVEGILEVIDAKINNSYLTIDRITNKYTIQDYIKEVKQELLKICNPKKTLYEVQIVNNGSTNPNTILQGDYQSFTIIVTVAGKQEEDYSRETIHVKVTGETDQQKMMRVVNATEWTEYSLKWIQNKVAWSKYYLQELKQDIIDAHSEIKDVDFNIFFTDGTSNFVLTDKLQTFHFGISVGKFSYSKSENLRMLLKLKIPTWPRTKEGIEAAPGVITQTKAFDPNKSKDDYFPFTSVYHIVRPTLWHYSADSRDYDGYWATFNIYVNWYNIHWACQREGNFYVNIFQHFIEYSGRSIAQAVQPAAWQNNPPDHTINWTPTYTNHVEKISPFDDSSLTRPNWKGAITCPTWWDWNLDSNPRFYDGLEEEMYNIHNNRSVSDITHMIYNYADHALPGTHGLRFQISFSLANGFFESRVYLGDGNCNYKNDTDLPTYW